MDILIMVVLLIGAVVGFIQGAFKQVANFAGVVIGLYAAVALYDNFGHKLASMTGSGEGISNLIAFALLVVVVPILLGFLASLLTRLFSAVHLGCVNRLAGALIGVLCHALLLSFAFNLYDFASSNGGLHPEKLEQRTSLFYVVKQATQPIIPDVLIVTDTSEELQGATPRHGMADLFR